MNVKCPKCKDGFTLKIEGGRTLMGAASPPGHFHDPNHETWTMGCECGHYFKYKPKIACPNPNCEWVGQEEEYLAY